MQNAHVAKTATSHQQAPAMNAERGGLPEGPGLVLWVWLSIRLLLVSACRSEPAQTRWRWPRAPAACGSVPLEAGAVCSVARSSPQSTPRHDGGSGNSFSCLPDRRPAAAPREKLSSASSKASAGLPRSRLQVPSRQATHARCRRPATRQCPSCAAPRGGTRGVGCGVAEVHDCRKDGVERTPPGLPGHPREGTKSPLHGSYLPVAGSPEHGAGWGPDGPSWPGR